MSSAMVTGLGWTDTTNGELLRLAAANDLALCGQTDVSTTPLLCVHSRFASVAGLRDLADLPPLQDLASDGADQAWGARL